jgi:hypothetical protein
MLCEPHGASPAWQATRQHLGMNVRLPGGYRPLAAAIREKGKAAGLDP